MVKTISLPTISASTSVLSQTGFDPTQVQRPIAATHIDIEAPASGGSKTRAYWQEVFMQRLTPEQLTGHARFSHAKAMVALNGLAARAVDSLNKGVEQFLGRDVGSEDFWESLIRETPLRVMLDPDLDRLSLKVREQALVEAVESRAIDVELKRSLGNVLLILRVAEVIVTKGLPIMEDL